VKNFEVGLDEVRHYRRRKCVLKCSEVRFLEKEVST